MSHLLRTHIEEVLALTDPPRVGGTDAVAVVDDEAVIRGYLDELQPFDLAYVLQRLPATEQLELLGMVEPRMAAAALEHLDSDLQYRLLDHVGEEKARAVLAEMPLHHLTPLMAALHPLRAAVLDKLIDPDSRDYMDQIETLPDDAAGRRISVRYFEARKEWPAHQVIAHFRKVGRNVDVANYVYVVDHSGRLVGVASLREVLLSSDDLTLEEIMYTKVVSVDATSSQEAAAHVLNQYDFVALPVVDEAGHLIGIISADDIMDVMREEATEDIQMLGGSHPLEDSYLETPFLKLFRSRIGWLLVLFVAESFTGTIMRHFEDVLEQVIALAFFIPLLIDTGGNSGSQASTMVTRAIAVGEVKMKDFFRIVWREARVSLLLGLVMAAAAFIRAMMLGGPAILGLTVGITICLIVMVGTTVGAALPLIGKRFGIDPAVFSAPLITTVADGLGLLIYFRVAVWLMGIT